MTFSEQKKVIRVGVFGIGRGGAYARHYKELGIQLVAICGRNEQKLRDYAKSFDNVAVYTDLDQFLQHDMDAVVVANYFHQHAPVAIKALQAGKHVLSETAACKTIQEGVELCREVEKSGKTYMFAENFAYFSTNQEMRKRYKEGIIGDIKYAEGEYIHSMPMEEGLLYSRGLDHWRHHLPPTYYCTHALGPLMYMTDTMPTSVNALAITNPEQEKTRVKRGDPTAITLIRMNNGAIFRLAHGLGGHRYYYRLHGGKGMMETVGHAGDGKISILRNAWELQSGEHETVSYKTKFPAYEAEAKKTGHYGGDYWIMYHFAEAIRSGEQPYLNVYRGVAMTAVGIMAWKSALQSGAPVDIPDFANEEERKLYEHDDWSPWPEDRRPGQPWPSLRGELIPSEEAIAIAENIWSSGTSMYDDRTKLQN
jgi:predicted dehydrogenase